MTGPAVTDEQQGEGPREDEGQAAAPVRPRPRRQRPAWLRDWPTLRSVLEAWWYSVGGHDLRVAIYDARRAPGWILLGFVAIAWVATDFTLIPVGVAVGAWLVMMWLTRWLHWWIRRKVRRWCRPVIGLLALGWLALDAGVWVWVLALGLWLIVAGVTDTWRARNRLCAWLLVSLARSARVDPGEFAARRRQWDGKRLMFAEIHVGDSVRVEEQAVRERIASAVRWSMRHAGDYAVSWPAGRAVFEVKADPALPMHVTDMVWPSNLPGIPLGVTDEESATGFYEERDSVTGDVLLRHPLLMYDPSDEKHLLVVGGTGAGKSHFTRGLVARGLKYGWFPGGVFLFDGKGSSDYIPFEGREGVHCVARDPEEWQANLERVSAMMRARYEEDAEYHRGNRPKPHHPRYLVVLEEVQEIRSVLTPKVLDPILQQLSRQMRASNGRLAVVTQRPDAEDAIPGAVRDMLEYRYLLGYVSPVGARMVLGEDWRRAVDEYGAEPIPGRGLALMGKLIRIQGMRIDLPREHPEMEKLYPPKTGQSTPGDGGDGGGGGGQPPEDDLPSNVIRWAPRKAAAAAQDDAGHGSEAEAQAPTPPTGMPVVRPEQLAAPPATDAAAPAVGDAGGRPGRRRTV
ncbi:ATP-binding protein [Lentzea terrae]|uniref:ATP-binding protein n=1 Tax=Lentzea terrae TaxID=2200761 RepID=UPI000DD49838|nr:hypothetical protein [Lentzea terrae]